jgi:hypothetical protein
LLRNLPITRGAVVAFLRPRFAALRLPSCSKKTLAPLCWSIRVVRATPNAYAAKRPWLLFCCWAHLSSEIYRARIAALVETFESDAARERERTGAAVLGVKAILSHDPLYRPSTLARSPAPRVHAATKTARKAFYEIYAAFVSAFREASERLRRGDRDAPFPWQLSASSALRRWIMTT